MNVQLVRWMNGQMTDRWMNGQWINTWVDGQTADGLMDGQIIWKVSQERCKVTQEQEKALQKWVIFVYSSVKYIKSVQFVIHQLHISMAINLKKRSMSIQKIDDLYQFCELAKKPRWKLVTITERTQQEENGPITFWW